MARGTPAARPPFEMHFSRSRHSGDGRGSTPSPMRLCFGRTCKVLEVAFPETLRFQGRYIFDHELEKAT